MVQCGQKWLMGEGESIFIVFLWTSLVDDPLTVKDPVCLC